MIGTDDTQTSAEGREIVEMLVELQCGQTGPRYRCLRKPTLLPRNDFSAHLWKTLDCQTYVVRSCLIALPSRREADSENRATSTSGRRYRNLTSVLFDDQFHDPKSQTPRSRTVLRF